MIFSDIPDYHAEKTVFGRPNSLRLPSPKPPYASAAECNPEVPAAVFAEAYGGVLLKLGDITHVEPSKCDSIKSAQTGVGAVHRYPSSVCSMVMTEF
jgi:hypothetical protein